MYKFVFFVPESHVEQVKSAAFKAGAGKMGCYDQCAWQVLGEGQFRPLNGSDPYLGRENKLEGVKEYRVEMVCSEACIREVVDAFKASHPYEEPAYDVIALVEF